jgi:hypothetical protein
MYRWRFEQFKSSKGRQAISDWRKSVLSPARQAIFDTFLDRVAKMEKWPPEICRSLRKHPGKWELRWTAEKVEHRIFGFYSGPQVFAMLIGCTHKGRIYDPPSSFETMVDRARKLKTGEGVLSEYALSR